ESLGCDLKLPDQHESMRSEIESRLPKLPSSKFSYEFVKPDDNYTAVYKAPQAANNPHVVSK
ncbi:MAG: hypothetical protein PVH85_33040, partial [Desulfobacterales bacterium]